MWHGASTINVSFDYYSSCSIKERGSFRQNDSSCARGWLVRARDWKALELLPRRTDRWTIKWFYLVGRGPVVSQTHIPRTGRQSEHLLPKISVTSLNSSPSNDRRRVAGLIIHILAVTEAQRSEVTCPLSPWIVKATRNKILSSNIIHQIWFIYPLTNDSLVRINSGICSLIVH